MIEAISNSFVYTQTESCTTFHWCPEWLEFGFLVSCWPLCQLNHAKWKELISKVMAKGHKQREEIALFALV